MSSDATIPVKPLRADARRNREKIVDAARAAFAETGLDTQIDDVARRAGVGVGTVYRHFPTKDALVAAMIEAKFATMAERGRAILADPGDDAWEDLAGFMRGCGEQHLLDRALAQVVSRQPQQTFHEAAMSTGLQAAADGLLARAQAAGAARPDAHGEDVGIVMCGLGAVLVGWGDDAARRFLELALDGLRACGRPPLPSR